MRLKTKIISQNIFKQKDLIKIFLFNKEFYGNDIDSSNIRSQDCPSKCANTKECTHFTWKEVNSGTCYLKTVVFTIKLLNIS